jgi:hypothetical protein
MGEGTLTKHKTKGNERKEKNKQHRKTQGDTVRFSACGARGYIQKKLRAGYNKACLYYLYFWADDDGKVLHERGYLDSDSSLGSLCFHLRDLLRVCVEESNIQVLVGYLLQPDLPPLDFPRWRL